MNTIIPKYLYNNSQQSNQLSTSIHNTIQYIFQILIKIGCPYIAITSNLQQQFNQFIQPSNQRLQLIQWLIAIIYPSYHLDNQYINYSNHDDDPTTNKINKLSIILWSLGVMPFSKFTKNLDYHKYVQGLLGQESSLRLLFDLTQLADSKFSPNIKKTEQIANDLLVELIKYNSDLVNPNYDPYGVIFPSKYLQQNEENNKKINEQYKLMIQSLNIQVSQKIQQQLSIENNKLQETQRLFSQVDGYKQLFKHKYEKLHKAISQLIAKYEKQIPIDNKQQIKQLNKRRILNVSRNLCRDYKNYNKLINSIKSQQFNHSIKQLKQQIINMITNINEIQNIYE